jgi:hypothetical protein
MACMKYRLLRRERFLGCCHWAPGVLRRVPWPMVRYSLLIYGRGPVNYTSSCQIVRPWLWGTAWIDTLNGGGFYELLAAHGMAPFTDDLRLRRVCVAVARSHYRRICADLGHLVEIHRGPPVQVAGHDLVRVEFTAFPPDVSSHAIQKGQASHG